MIKGSTVGAEIRQRNPGSSVSLLIHLRKLVSLFKDPIAIVLIVAFVAYSCIWSYIGIAKFYALNSSVYDLGISMQTAYTIYSNQWTLQALISFIIVRNGLAVFMAPVALLANYPLMITIQAVFVGAAVFPIYGIGVRSGLGRTECIFVSVSYLIFYPLNGLVWFDFHYQMFFVFLFLLGYYLYLRGMLLTALVVFLLSGFTRYPFMLFPFLFSLLLLIEFAVRRYIHRQNEIRTLYFATALFILTSLVLFAGYILVGGVSSLPLHTGASGGNSITLYARLFTLFMLLAPLLFVPILSYRWYLLELPFLFLLFTSGSGTYLYPSLFLRQYSSGITPFLFLGLIDGLSNLQKLTSWIETRLRHKLSQAAKTGSGKKKTKVLIRLTVKRIAVILVFVILASASLFYQPYGPFNHLAGVNYHLSDVTSVNMTIFNSLQNVLSLIPKNEPHVLIQNNIVLALPGPIGRILLVPQYDVGPNITSSNIQNNTFPYKEGNVFGKTQIDYAIADVNEQNTLKQHGLTYFPSMLELCQMLISSGYYGIRAEENNILLLQRGYVGPASFRPFQSTYLANEFHFHTGSIVNGVLKVTNPTSGPAMWYGPFTNPFVAYLSLSPGNYQATYVLATDNNSHFNNMRLTIESNGGTVILNDTTVNGTDLGPATAWTRINVNFTLNNMLSGIELDSLTGNWSGSVFLQQIELRQLSLLTPAQLGPIIGLPGSRIPTGTYVNASSYTGDYVPANAIDGDLHTAWISEKYYGELFLTFPRQIALKGIMLAAGLYPSGNLSIAIAGLNSTWLNLSSGNRFVGGGSTGYTELAFLFGDIQCSQLRISCSSGNSLVRVNEITLLLAS